MTLRSSDLQSDSDLDSIRNSCDVCEELSNNNVFQTAKNVMINPRENELKVQIEDQEKTTLCRRVTSYFSRLRLERTWRGAAGQLSGRPMRP